MEIDSSIKKGIIASLIATFIFIMLLEPIGKLIWNIVASTSSQWYSSFSDSIYTEASRGHRNWLDLLTFSIITIISLSGFFIIIFIFKQAINEFYLKNKLVNVKSQVEKENLLKKKISSLKRMELLIMKVGKPFFYISFLYLLYALFSNGTMIFKAYADLQLNTSFNQRMDIIEPYIEIKEFKILKSKWALMKNRNDFLEINQKIEEYANKNNIQLPELLLK